MRMDTPYADQIRFRKVDFEKIPRHACGVYGIWFKRRCIYIGKAASQSIWERLLQHWRGSHNPVLSAWIQAKGSELKVSFQVADDVTQINALEKICIHRFQPLTNKVRYSTPS